MEKKVVLEEIAMAKDHLEHLAFDFLQEKVFAGHPLAWPILGYEQTIDPLTRDQMETYFQRRYCPSNMLLAVAGCVDPQEIIACAEACCGSWPVTGDHSERIPPQLQGGVDFLRADRFKQQVVALTFPSVSARDERAETASATAAILGGDNSRFFWGIVQHGIAPRAGAFHLDYTDCGAMILYGVCDPENVERLVEAMRSEAARMSRQRVEAHEVQRVKNKRRTSLAIESEAPYHRLTQLMDDMEYRGAPRTVEQMLAEVDAVSADTVYEYLQACPINGDGHLASVGPRPWPDGR
jgi:predicted Zn-dependent peptidase